jgi:hypothetical protein
MGLSEPHSVTAIALQRGPSAGLCGCPVLSCNRQLCGVARLHTHWLAPSEPGPCWPPRAPQLLPGLQLRAAAVQPAGRLGGRRTGAEGAGERRRTGHGTPHTASTAITHGLTNGSARRTGTPRARSVPATTPVTKRAARPPFCSWAPHWRGCCRTPASSRCGPAAPPTAPSTAAPSSGRHQSSRLPASRGARQQGRRGPRRAQQLPLNPVSARIRCYTARTATWSGCSATTGSSSSTSSTRARCAPAGRERPRAARTLQAAHGPRSSRVPMLSSPAAAASGPRPLLQHGCQARVTCPLPLCPGGSPAGRARAVLPLGWPGLPARAPGRLQGERPQRRTAAAAVATMRAASTHLRPTRPARTTSQLPCRPACRLPARTRQLESLVRALSLTAPPPGSARRPGQRCSLSWLAHMP